MGRDESYIAGCFGRDDRGTGWLVDLDDNYIIIVRKEDGFRDRTFYGSIRQLLFRDIPVCRMGIAPRPPNVSLNRKQSVGLLFISNVLCARSQRPQTIVPCPDPECTFIMGVGKSVVVRIVPCGTVLPLTPPLIPINPLASSRCFANEPFEKETSRHIRQDGIQRQVLAHQMVLLRIEISFRIPTGLGNARGAEFVVLLFVVPLGL